MKKPFKQLAGVGAVWLATSAFIAHAEEVDETPDLSACVAQVLDFVEGPVSYTGVNAQVNGGYNTFRTTSDHVRLEDGSWEYSSFGGDMEERSTSYVRQDGNKILTREAGGDGEEAVRTFTECEGPDEVGRITTQSSYELPPVPSDPQTLYVDIVGLYGEQGAFFTEVLKNEAGEIVARRSGVTLPIEE
ncbi:MAG: hypothetical protein AAGJ32_11485 [Pseudomonadota bacterium]